MGTTVRDGNGRSVSERAIVARYLDYLEAKKRQRTTSSPDALLTRIDKVNASMPKAKAMDRLLLIQERLDLEERLASSGTLPDGTSLEDDFVDVCTSYSDRRGISYTAWRTIGVPAAVLQRAGFARTRMLSSASSG